MRITDLEIAAEETSPNLDANSDVDSEVSFRMR